MTVACGTMTYMAPEIFGADGTSAGYTHQVDMWSVGIIMYLVLSGFLPFANKDDSDQDIVRKTKEGLVDFSDPLWQKISPEAKDLIRCLLQVSPDKRITADESLRHPWFSKVFPVPPDEPHPDVDDHSSLPENPSDPQSEHPLSPKSLALRSPNRTRVGGLS